VIEQKLLLEPFVKELFNIKRLQEILASFYIKSLYCFSFCFILFIHLLNFLFILLFDYICFKRKFWSYFTRINRPFITNESYSFSFGIVCKLFSQFNNVVIYQYLHEWI